MSTTCSCSSDACSGASRPGESRPHVKSEAGSGPTFHNRSRHYRHIATVRQRAHRRSSIDSVGDSSTQRRGNLDGIEETSTASRIPRRRRSLTSTLSVLEHRRAFERDAAAVRFPLRLRALLSICVFSAGHRGAGHRHRIATLAARWAQNRLQLFWTYVRSLSLIHI